QDNGSVIVELDMRSVRPSVLLRGPHDDRFHHLTLFDGAARYRLLDGSHNHVADIGVLLVAASQHANAHQLAGSGVVGDTKPRLLLDHRALLAGPRPPTGCSPAVVAWRSTCVTRQCFSLLMGRVSVIST